MRKLTQNWRPVTLAEITDAIYQIKRVIEKGPRSGFKGLDEAIGGVWRDGVVISGLPGKGKSIFVTHLAVFFASHGHEVVYLDLENDRKDVLERLFLVFAGAVMGTRGPTKMQLADNPAKHMSSVEVNRLYHDLIGDRMWLVDAAYEKKITPKHLDELVEERWRELDKVEKQVILIIDSKDELNTLWPLVGGEYESEQRWLAEIKHIRAKYQIPVILVSHVAKDKKSGTMNPKGTSGMGHFARTQFIVEEEKGERSTIMLRIVRSQFGETGRVRLHLDRTRLSLTEREGVTIP